MIASDHINPTKLVGCPKCRKYKFEIETQKILDLYNINYEQQKSFIGCKNKNSLKFDFYLYDFNLCIECHGQQHYKEIKYFYGKEGFLKRLKKDQIKRDYCIENDIMLIEIPYWERKNLEDYLINKFSDYNILLNKR
jgi:hypothetical protein